MRPNVKRKVLPKFPKKIFKNKYETLYSSVPTNSTELDNINSEVDALLYQDDNSLCNVTPKIIDKYITSLKKNKSDGNKGFNSNHLIYGPPRLKVLLSILFNSMHTVIILLSY